MAEIKPDIETFAKIKVVGVGGSGGSAINRMITSKIRGVEFIAMNTDVQALHMSLAPTKIHIGKTVTRGLGAGMDPEIGQRAAEESQEEIRESLKGADMVFITCGLGGGTGSGAGPKVAEIAKEMGALTVAVVTKPFIFEGAQRKTIADGAHNRLAEYVDTIITIPNDRVLQIIDRKTSLIDAFEIVDDVLRQGVQGISELITVHGNINVDFADVRAIMSNRGSALMGIGRGNGENRAADAAKAAIASPLLEVSIDGAKGILFTIAGGSGLGMYEVSEAAKIITQSADPAAKVIFGAIIDENLKDEVKITVIATGFDMKQPSPAKKIVANSTATPVHQVNQASNSSQNQNQVQSDRLSTRPTPPPEPLAPLEFSVMRQTPVQFVESAVEEEEQHYEEEEAIEEDLEPIPSAFVKNTPAPAAHQPHVRPPVHSNFSTRPAPTNPISAPVLTNKDQDDIEMPSFLRKKMM